MGAFDTISALASAEATTGPVVSATVDRNRLVAGRGGGAICGLTGVSVLIATVGVTTVTGAAIGFTSTGTGAIAVATPFGVTDWPFD